MDRRLAIAWMLTALIGVGAHFFASGSTAELALESDLKSAELTMEEVDVPSSQAAPIQALDGPDSLLPPLPLRQESTANPRGEPDRKPGILAPPIVAPAGEVPRHKVMYLDYSSDELREQLPESQEDSPVGSDLLPID